MSRRPSLPPTLGLCALLLTTGALVTTQVACRGNGPAARPSLTGATPSEGYQYDEITITGSGLGATTQVLVAGRPSPRVTRESDTRLRVEVPAGPAEGPLILDTGRGRVVSVRTFRILAAPAAPTIAAFAPALAAAGDTVTLTGSGFTLARQVLFHGLPAPFQVVDDAHLTATVPAGFSAGAITVRLPGGVATTASGTFQVAHPAPILGTFTPLTGPAGAEVILTGQHLEHVVAVTVGSRPVQPFTAEATRLRFTLPPTALTGPIAVTDTLGNTVATAVPFTVQAPAPAVTAFTPATGAVGDWVTVTGSRLGQVTGLNLGGVTAEVVEAAAPDGTSLRFRVPPTALTGPVVVQSAAGAFPVPGGPFTVTTPPLSADGFTPNQGLPGTQVTLTGQNLEQVTGVAFGDAVTTVFSTTGDTLITAVPDGATTGPVRLLTPGGDIQVPGGAFTVLEATPVITGFSPAGGYPGTEVTLVGQNLGAFTELSYGTLVIPHGEVEHTADGLRFRVPDGANAASPITVVTPGGTTASAAAFGLIPTRITALNMPVVVRSDDFAGAMLDFPGIARTAQYGINLPTAPVLHPYNPGDGPGLRPDHFVVKYTLSLRLPTAFYPALPRPVQEALAGLGLDRSQVDLLVASQDYAYTGALGAGGAPDPDSSYLFRPHYWTDPEAPETGAYNTAHAMRGGFFETEPGLTVDNHPAGELFDFNISVHPAAGSAIVSSGPTEPVRGLDINRTTAFWSVAKTGDRAAATLHLLFADGDQAHLETLAETAPTLGDLMNGSPALNGTRAFRMLRQLARPMVAVAESTDLPAERVVVLRGSGFAGLTAVQLNGADVPFTALSDALARITLPLSATGTVVLVTPYGASDPFPLP